MHLHTEGDIQIWSNDPSVLHISPEQFSSDYDGTVACIWRFLHGSDDRVDSFTSLMMESKEFAHWRSRGDTIKFSDLLLSKGVDDFAKAHWSLNAVLSRQAAIYGCPQPN
eukprot:TRINITY_DN38654_c0_g1_i3.p2 TRINITY_DN38654_c0_g1~~TRINITY_DN38654_c0_g1_i3.p2  ORF type:complete len:110 (-),score=24.90 TRINITY_DN38654_c0_g1_i3:150-479(-)